MTPSAGPHQPGTCTAPAAIPPHRPKRPSPRAHPASSSLRRAAVTPPNRAPRQSPPSRAATPLYPAVYPHRHRPHLELPLAPLKILRAARRHHTERRLRRRRATRAAPPYAGHRQSPPAGAGVALSLPSAAVQRQQARGGCPGLSLSPGGLAAGPCSPLGLGPAASPAGRAATCEPGRRGFGPSVRKTFSRFPKFISFNLNILQTSKLYRKLTITQKIIK
jgi:hypothetical protein